MYSCTYTDSGQETENFQHPQIRCVHTFSHYLLPKGVLSWLLTHFRLYMKSFWVCFSVCDLLLIIIFRDLYKLYKTVYHGFVLLHYFIVWIYHNVFNYSTVNISILRILRIMLLWIFFYICVWCTYMCMQFSWVYTYKKYSKIDISWANSLLKLYLCLHFTMTTKSQITPRKFTHDLSIC